MFGQNPLRHAEDGSGRDLLVHSIFYTLQGEGPFAGRPSVFLRLAGCNLRCFFCDTEFEKGAKRLTIEEIVEQISVWGRPHGLPLVVITGGEPMRQPLEPLLMLLYNQGFKTQIETSGSIWPRTLSVAIADLMAHFVCSPKTGKVAPHMLNVCRDWKYIIDKIYMPVDPTDGLPIWSTQVRDKRQRIFRPPQGQGHQIWVQPCEKYHADGTPDRESTRANELFAAELAMEHGYRLSLQQHKYLGLP